jgi:hypothetical protein
MSNIRMIAHQGTQAHAWGPAAVHPVGLLAVLASVVLAVIVLAAASFSGVRADPVIHHHARTIEGPGQLVCEDRAGPPGNVQPARDQSSAARA